MQVTPAQPARLPDDALEDANDDADHAARLESPRPGHAAWVAALTQAACAAAAALALAWGIHTLNAMSVERADRAIELLLATAVLCCMGVVGTGQWFRWTRPVRRLADLADRARRGEIPIEELSRATAAGGGVAPLVPAVQALLREIRRQRATIAALEADVRQRVAQRTDALERMIGSLRQQATRDVLTGLYNRRMLDQHLPALVDRCRTDGQDLCLLMMDVDHFKPLNDTLGHAAGDEMLRAIGQLIRSAVREHDAAFRCGGDEFVVVLPGSGPVEGRALGARLSSLVAALAETLRVTPKPGLSVGLTAISLLPAGFDATAETLCKVADKALYDAKGARRRGAASPRAA